MAPGARRTACPERRKRVPRRRPRVSTAGAHQTRKGHGPEDAGAGRPRASRVMLGGDAEAALDAYSLEDVPIGRLELTPSLIERARAERRDASLA